MATSVYFVQHLSGHDERLLVLSIDRVDLAHAAVQRIVAGLQPLDRIELRGCRFDCAASLLLGLRRRICEAEADACGWRVFDERGVLRCKKLPDDVGVIYPQGAGDVARWGPLIAASRVVPNSSNQAI
ncbi:hypothetical protein J7J08_06730 [Stenotrophomonas sp. ISL-67]|uniref:hypothetical protein n=1 Tax=Stenotrophomonas sp. ISL-67 TaxID=2819171 RepID=UPI001BE4F1E8|nr:hypothetical protein [Stenotrophomonas sp. ISL-67]MBT2767328.1 hypothetical protein [Stenotrophomonas sp. ISL-67]